MVKFIILLVFILVLAASYGGAVECYNCYDSFNKALTLGTLSNANFGEKFVRCDKNKNNWNTWNCPARWPICIVMSGTVQNHYEVVRSCAEKNFCKKYVPPNEAEVHYCRECNTTLCNDYPRLPDPPVEPGSLFTFNVNINLNLQKYTTTRNNEDTN